MSLRLWSVWKGSSHIGWAIGDHNAATLQRAMGSAFAFRPTSYAPPERWAPQWIAIWKSKRPPAQYGAFLKGWNLWVVWQLENIGLYNASTSDAGLSRV